MDDDKKRIAVISVSSLLLVAVVVAVIVCVVTNKSDDKPEVSTSTKAIHTLCNSVDYQHTCVKGLSSKEYNQTDDPKELVKIGLKDAIKQVKAAVNKSVTLENLEHDPRAKEALNSCSELTNSSVRDLERSFNKFSNLGVIADVHAILADLKVWISGAITYEQTCLDGFHNVTGEAGDKMRDALKLGMEMTTNTLAMVTEIATAFAEVNAKAPAQRRLLSYPGWLDPTKRKLLQSAPKKFEANVIVAQDGSGKYKTINEALKDIPKSSSRTFVIQIKEGVYVEKVEILSSMTNVLLLGDGPDKTKITGKLNVVDGTTTYKSATVAVHGDNFIAKDIGFENSAGAEKEQAVALRVSADKTIFYNCWMDGYQDTLYTHTYRQYYRDCTISGTIDFVFGDSTVVFQNCIFLVRKPLDNQRCIVTAQGRKNIRQPTGIVLQNCTITADSSLKPVKSNVNTYLARPWKEYSRTVTMESYIDDVIQPEGYLPWDDTFAFNTLFYTEFNNRGPGSSKDKRVKWPGIKELTTDRIKRFTATHFIDGDLWIPRTKVPYASSLIQPPPKNEPVAASPMSQEEDISFNSTQTKQQSELQDALRSPPSTPSPKPSSHAPPSGSNSPPPKSSSGTVPAQAPTFHESPTSGPSPSASTSSSEPDKTFDFGSVFDSQSHAESPVPSSPASDPKSASTTASAPASASGTASVPASRSRSSTSPSPSPSSRTSTGASPSPTSNSSLASEGATISPTSPSPTSNSSLASKDTTPFPTLNSGLASKDATPFPTLNSVLASKDATPIPILNSGRGSKDATPSPTSNSGLPSIGAIPSPTSPSPISNSDLASKDVTPSPTSNSGLVSKSATPSPTSNSGMPSKSATSSLTSNSGLASKGATPSPTSNSGLALKDASPSPSSSSNLGSKGGSPYVSPNSNSGLASKGASSIPSPSLPSKNVSPSQSPSSSSGISSKSPSLFSSPSSISGSASHGSASSPSSSSGSGAPASSPSFIP